jgi:hypothetical protein
VATGHAKSVAPFHIGGGKQVNIPRIEKGIILHASVEEVLDRVEEPANTPENWPSVIEVQDVVQLPVLRKLAESFLTKMNENEPETIGRRPAALLTPGLPWLRDWSTLSVPA